MGRADLISSTMTSKMRCGLIGAGAMGIAQVAIPAAAEIPAMSIFAERTPLWGHSLSPDGKRAIVRRLIGNSRQIDVVDLSSGDFADLHGYKYRFASWRPDSRGLFAIKNPNLYSVNVWPVSKPQVITPSGLGSWRVVGYPNHQDFSLVVATQTRSSAPLQNLYECPATASVSDGCVKVGGDFPPTGLMVRGVDGQVQLKMTFGGNGDVIWQRRLEKNRWKEAFRHPPDNVFQPVGVLGGDGRFFAISSRHHSFPRLVHVDSDSGNETPVLSFDDRGIAKVTMNSRGTRPIMATSIELSQKRHFLEPSLEPVFSTLEEQFDREVWFRVLSVDQTDRLFTVSVQSPDTVEAIYLLNSKTGTVKKLTQRSYAEFADLFGTASKPRIRTRDGETINGIVTIPRRLDGQQKLPLVVRLHGGPWDRYFPKFDRTAQFLSGNGYAVLNLNYRGSSGFGRAFQEAIIGRLFETIQADIEDAVRWASKELPIDPNRVAIMGFSFGGYMALRNGLADKPIFKVAISNSGIADLERFWIRQQTTPVSKFMWNKYLGLGERFSRQSELRHYLAINSPINGPSRISIPILVVAGERDQRVSTMSTRRFVESSTKNNKNVQSMFFAREGHVIRGTRNLIDWHERILKFLNNHL